MFGLDSLSAGMARDRSGGFCRYVADIRTGAHSYHRAVGSDVSSFLTGSSSDDPSPQRRVVEAYWIDLERVLEAD